MFFTPYGFDSQPNYMPTAAPLSRDGCRYFTLFSGLPFETAPFYAISLPAPSDLQGAAEQDVLFDLLRRPGQVFVHREALSGNAAALAGVHRHRDRIGEAHVEYLTIQAQFL